MFKGNQYLTIFFGGLLVIGALAALILPKISNDHLVSDFKINSRIGDGIKNNLEKYKLTCGKYPSTEDGLAALTKESCKGYAPSSDPKYYRFTDSKGKPILYFSNTKKYNLIQITGESQFWTPEGSSYRKRTDD